MKRKDLEVGGLYADVDGRQVEIVSLDPGWKVEKRKWVKYETHDRRFVRGKWIAYQTNTTIQIKVYAEGKTTKDVIEPRYIKESWETYAKTQEALVAEVVEQGKQMKHWYKALKAVGLKNIKIDFSRSKAEMGLDDLATLLSKAGVEVEA